MPFCTGINSDYLQAVFLSGFGSDVSFHNNNNGITLVTPQAVTVPCTGNHSFQARGFWCRECKNHQMPCLKCPLWKLLRGTQMTCALIAQPRRAAWLKGTLGGLCAKPCSCLCQEPQAGMAVRPSAVCKAHQHWPGNKHHKVACIVSV